mgnify:CR=1 FL=1
MAENDVRVRSEDLQQFTSEVFVHAGVAEEDAEIEA